MRIGALQHIETSWDEVFETADGQPILKTKFVKMREGETRDDLPLRLCVKLVWHGYAVVLGKQGQVRHRRAA